MNTTAITHPAIQISWGHRGSAAATAVNDEREPGKFAIRIGSTTYTVTIHFSETSTETLDDKILRLAQNDGLDFQSGNADPTRTGRLPERSSTDE
ncbi:MAG: transposon-encoded TnpW family protein [Lachnospiraceae bacterium]|jgi:hypothetical protein|nr:transposon-encoded TnpW family protein [Lachnospiraceae bacterium]